MTNEKALTRHIVWLTLLLVGLLLCATLWLRLANLGYSNLQGDEIKALCRPASGQNLIGFFLGQRKGPVQFLVTCAIRVFDRAYSNEFALRLPFALAGCLCVLGIYLLARRFFSQEVALYAALLMATNGLFIAFSRIVQYQSITILCTLLGLYGLTLAVQEEKWKINGLYLGFIAAAIGLLAHFDGVYALPPMAFLLYLWWKKYQTAPGFSGYRKHLLAALGIFAALLLSFYIPYVLHLNDYQLDYWHQRILEISSGNTWQFFQIFNPGPVAWIYVVLIVLGAFRLRNNAASIMLLSWLLPPFVLIEFLISDPRTHFYTYLLPLLLLVALGFETLRLGLERFIKGYAQPLVHIMAFVLFGFSMALGQVIFVDHHPEYPLQPKTFLNLKLPGGIAGNAFGFPYNRDWKEIRGWFTLHQRERAVFTTNEETTVATYYLPNTMHYVKVDQRYLNRIGDSDGIYVLLIENPQSYINSFWGLGLDEWMEKEKPLRVFVNKDGAPQAAVYYLTKKEIKTLLP